MELLSFKANLLQNTGEANVTIFMNSKRGQVVFCLNKQALFLLTSIHQYSKVSIYLSTYHNEFFFGSDPLLLFA